MRCACDARSKGSASRSSLPPVRSPPPWLVLTIGLVAVSTAAPLIKLAAVPALAIAAWRTAATGALYGGVSGGGTAGGPLTGREWVRLLSGGALMAAHFGLWIAAFEWTVRAWSDRATGDPLLTLLAWLRRGAIAETRRRRRLRALGPWRPDRIVQVDTGLAVLVGMSGEQQFCEPTRVRVVIVRPAPVILVVALRDADEPLAGDE